MPSLLKRQAPPTLTREVLAAHRHEAEAILRTAEADFGHAALAFAEQLPGAAKTLTDAQAAIATARGTLQALDAAGLQLEAAERQREADAAREARERIDAKVRALAKVRTSAASTLSESSRAFVAAYDAWLSADEALKDGMAIAPHLRDVFATTAHQGASVELARLSAGRDLAKCPPGVSRAAFRDDPRTIKPLTDACAQEAEAIFN